MNDIPLKWAHDKLGIPEAVGGEKVLTVGNPPPVDVPTEKPAKAALKYTPVAATNDDVTPIDPLTDAMSREAAPALGAMVEQIRQMVESAQSLEQLRDALLAAYGGIDTTELARVMALGFSVADLTGRFDADAESNG